MKREIIQNLREDYTAASLSEHDVVKNPINQFERWFKEALDAKVTEPNAMTLATATTAGRPSARIVLLKDFNSDGFVFYTNYLSRKGKELAKNPFASLLFFWPELQRQVNIEGTVEKVSREESEKYFHSRPKGSQVGAIVSPQSQEIASRDVLEKKWIELEAAYADKTVPKPAHWGGYILKPNVVEFWQGGPSRLHDRIVFKRADKNSWKIVRLAP
ncbi:pyridoxamine 5'-phosphate oxidase [Mucilaginibacter paludis]|uniref:Pyridoxine/pyridoxamine 5'-phosphate oxidase n=1 Tax=Mucilaginibacter paludis DSM 18603 TaxID=714943 RepID=H1Y7L2_9SPHI|nr:pyridoxamine 5'-phosphate oxidase [Mucilaginibacter paludis]EHQ29433.1 Pyridoxine/pyridoxamine 5'-phosphate oxidase [Mucilaginibacter paludis DSM 18603]